MVLDDLPRGIVIAGTSNCKLRDFEERFQTRFQAFEIAPPALRKSSLSRAAMEVVVALRLVCPLFAAATV